ncbi:MAG: ribosome maturation factor RimP [Gammaproteobacteria bacterium]|nr:ribosome maturation factor RimP [Gammaproteobacteria bacterium]
MTTIVDSLNNMLQPVIETMGYEFVGIEYISHEKGTILRIYVDHKNGITVDGCAEVSRQVSAVLDVEDPISGEYTLEVSSPGLDRPLFTKEHYQKFIDHEIKLTLNHPLTGTNQKRYRGVINSVDEESGTTIINLTVDLGKETEQVSIPLEIVKKANLTVNF